MSETLERALPKKLDERAERLMHRLSDDRRAQEIDAKLIAEMQSEQQQQ